MTDAAPPPRPTEREQLYLVFGDVGHQYPVGATPETPLIAVELATDTSASRRSTYYLRPPDTAGSAARVLFADGSPARTVALAAGVPTWGGVSFGPEFVAALIGTGDPRLTSGTLLAVSPLVIARVRHSAEAASAGQLEVYACTRLRACGAVFARVTALPVADPTVDEIARLSAPYAATMRGVVATEWRNFRSFEPGVEIEIKLTLTEPTSSWGVAAALAESVARGGFEGFIPDVGNEMQRWHFRQDTYEVREPADARGYIAFLHNPNGGFGLKHKIFDADTLRRIERFRDPLDLQPDELDAFLAREYPDFEVVKLPQLVRSRFDVNVESISTGHFFGLEIDEVTTIEDQPRTLRQAEIEYHRSRIHEGLRSEDIDADLFRLADLVESELARLGLASSRGYYSKLTFLRDGRSAALSG